MKPYNVFFVCVLFFLLLSSLSVVSKNWTVDSLDFLFRTLSNNIITFGFHLYITESQIVVAKVDDDDDDETEHRRRAKLWRELGVVSFIFEREESATLFVRSLFLLSELNWIHNSLFPLKEFITFRTFCCSDTEQYTRTSERKREREQK